MNNIAFVTYREIPSLTDDDRLFADFLKHRGVNAVAVIWDSPDVRWEEFDLIILRSCWEYHFRAREFSKWIARMSQKNLPLFNPPQVVERNMDKSYLRELAAKGARLAPTIWLEKGAADADIKESLAARRGWREAVVKPTVSMSAYQTWITSPESGASDEKRVRKILEKSGVMIQKFIPEVRFKGEWSFIFFGKQYSHAVLKRPKAGDFRVQRDFGGFLDFKQPTEELVAQAQKIIEMVKEPLLYARVDGIEAGGGELILMELELIDPVLFLASDTLSLERFRDAAMLLLQSTRQHAGSNTRAQANLVKNLK